MSESVPHDFNKCHCDQWGRCLVHCETCTCVADARANTGREQRPWPYDGAKGRARLTGNVG